MIWVYFVVSMTGRVERFLGKGGIYLIRKFFGIILLAISVRLFTANITLLIEALHKSDRTGKLTQACFYIFSSSSGAVSSLASLSSSSSSSSSAKGCGR